MPFFERLALRRKALLVLSVILVAHSLLSLLVLYAVLAGFPKNLVLSWPPASVGVLYLAVLCALAVAAVLVASRAMERLTRPVVELTRLADQISTGDLQVQFRFGRPVRCWEIKGCQESTCRAFGNTELQCWYVDGTPCHGVEPRFPAKLAQCRRCEVYQAHRGDEIVQLADSFQHMTQRLRESQDQLLRSERLAAIGEAAAMVSHSTKNILDGLMGGVYVYRSGRRRNDEQMKTKGWEMLERNLGAISELVLNLLNFSRARDPVLEPCDAERMVADVLSLHAERAERQGALLEARCQPGIGRVWVDVHSLFNSLVNLVTNALDALPAGRPGRVALGVEVVGDRLVFSVSDDGIGIAPELRPRLFAGMFSTKGSKGTGLGLLSVQKAAREHRGTVEFESEPGQGAVFRIDLPLRTEAVVPPSRSLPQGEAGDPGAPLPADSAAPARLSNASLG